MHVTAREGEAKAVLTFGADLYAEALLGEGVGLNVSVAARSALEGLDHTGARRSDRQLRNLVAVEVPDRNRGAEVGLVGRVPGHTRRVLREEIRIGRALVQADRVAVDHSRPARPLTAAEAVLRRSDGQIVDSVVVEIAHGQRVPESGVVERGEE